MAFTEFYCDPVNGSNANGGDSTGAPTFTSAVGTWDGTSVYTTTTTTGAAVGQFANVGGSYVARITTVTLNVSITLSTTAKSGTAPGAGVTTVNVSGALKGPNGATAFPFGFVTNALTNAAGDFPRVNLKNNATYSVTAAMTHGNAGPVQFQGYATTVGDGGRATIDGGTSGVSYLMLNVTGAQTWLEDLVFQNNGASGIASGVDLNATGVVARRVVVNSVRAHGLRVINAGAAAVECEAYGCNQSNTSGAGGFFINGGLALRCLGHDNTVANGEGFQIQGGCVLVDCVADSNTKYGYSLNANNIAVFMTGCDSYNNGSHGLVVGNAAQNTAIYAENGSHVKNGGYGVTGNTTGKINGTLINLGFGAGTQANTSGQTASLGAIAASGAVTYAADVTPWADPANGDFRISLAAAKGVGRGSFTQTATSYTGTVGYPDIGAAQHQETTPVGRARIVQNIGTY